MSDSCAASYLTEVNVITVRTGSRVGGWRLALALFVPVVAGCTSSLASSSPASPLASTTTTSTSRTTEATSASHVSFLAQSVSFISDDDAWVLGVARCLTGWCTAVRYTDDRGADWATVAAPAAPVSSNRPDGVSEIRFANRTDGFAFEPGLWSTYVGGDQWHEVRLPGAVLALAAAGQSAYALVAPCWPFVRPCTSAALLYRSLLGRDDWHQLLRLPSVQQGQLALNGRSVYLLAETAAGSYLLASSDGTRFTRLVNPCPPTSSVPRGYSLSGLAVTTPTDVAVVCEGGREMSAGTVSKLAYLSTDGGHAYHEVALPPIAGYVEELAAPTPSTLVLTAFSLASYLYRTSGPDKAWTTPLIGDGGIGFTDLGFTDATHGAVIYGQAEVATTILANPPPHLGALYLTDDGGANWYRANLS
jgi:hypothetical protein